MAVNKLSIFIPHASDFLTNHQPHGDGLAAFGFISRLAERGHTLHVAAPEMDIKGALSANIELHTIKTLAKSTGLHRLEYMLKSRLLLNRLRRKGQIDVIHQLNPVNKGLSLAMIGSGLPVVLGVIVPGWPQDAEDSAPKQSRLNRLVEAVKMGVKSGLMALQQWQASALLVATPAARNFLYNAEQFEHKIVHLSFGVDTTRFYPNPESRTSNEPNILFLANLWRRKGIFTLLEAFAQVAERLPNCRLTIAGGGGEQEEVERLVAASPYRDRIKLLGPVGRDKVPGLLRGCTLYCHPAYGEPFANSVLEALASGKPVVATNAGGIREMIPDGGGRKVPPRDAQALAEALIEVVSSPELQAEMGRCNRHRVEHFYAWNRIIDRLEAVYTQVIAEQQEPQGEHSLPIY
ncbi:MAG: glycosyltransferase family 4 protein [Acidobacteriota bacterium]